MHPSFQDDNKFSVPKAQDADELEQRANRIKRAELLPLNSVVGTRLNHIEFEEMPPHLELGRQTTISAESEKQTHNQPKADSTKSKQKKPKIVIRENPKDAKPAKPLEVPAQILFKLQPVFAERTMDIQKYYKYVSPPVAVTMSKKVEVFRLMIRYVTKEVVPDNSKSLESSVLQLPTAPKPLTELQISNNMINVNLAPTFTRRFEMPLLIESVHETVYFKPLPPKPPSSSHKNSSKMLIRGIREDSKTSRPQLDSQHSQGPIEVERSLHKDTNSSQSMKNSIPKAERNNSLPNEISTDTKNLTDSLNRLQPETQLNSKSEKEVKQGSHGSQEDELFKSCFKTEYSKADSKKSRAPGSNQSVNKPASVHSEKQAISRISRHSGLLDFEDLPSDPNQNKIQAEVEPARSIKVIPSDIKSNQDSTKDTPLSRQAEPALPVPKNLDELIVNMFKQHEHLKDSMKVRFVELKLTKPIQPCGKTPQPPIPTFSISLRNQFAQNLALQTYSEETPAIAAKVDSNQNFSGVSQSKASEKVDRSANPEE